ncbi:hypothetical protein KAR52_02940 [Candidatus Pacearchaeota archaeon]|nr:hypothetical protein [Candidatus Pacearchaeota archaeon]
METLYHITTKKKLMKIQKEGCLKPKRPLWDWINILNFKKYPKGVYLSKSPYWFKAIHESFNKKKFNDIVILEIDVGNLKLIRDLEYPTSFLYAEEIPFKNVKQIFYITDQHLEMGLKIIPKTFMENKYLKS